MKKNLILDSKISYKDYINFKKAVIVDDGLAIIFTMAIGVSYKVPIDYLLKWGIEPLKKPLDSTVKKKDLRFVRSRRTRYNRSITVAFNNGCVQEVAWDTVLMACEPMYEHFGGLTKESKVLTKKYSHCVEIVHPKLPSRQKQ